MTGKTVVVTGAGSGIGRSTALAFAKDGARIALCDVDRARVDEVARELGGERVLVASAVDVADRAQMQAFADAVHAKVAAVDVVVNNAGVVISGNFLDITLDDWDWLLGVNLRGVVHGCHMFAPRMVERGQGGHIANVSSIFGVYPAPGVTPYIASKFAVLGFSQSLRADLAPHRIGVTAICPGMIATQIVADGRMSGQYEKRRNTLRDTFSKRGASPLARRRRDPRQRAHQSGGAPGRPRQLGDLRIDACRAARRAGVRGADLAAIRRAVTE